jgi:hypothetical protein
VTAIAKSTPGVLKEGLTVRAKICVIISSGVDIIIVSNIEEQISKDDQGNLFF